MPRKPIVPLLCAAFDTLLCVGGSAILIAS